MPESDRQTQQAWILVGALILVQFLLFRQQLIREILWSYPAHHDQSNFLHQTQEIYFKMLDSGFWSGLLFGLRHSVASSFMLPIQGSLAFYLFGPKRAHALTLVFLYFALLQVVLAHTLRRLTGLWSVSFIGQGLLIGTGSRFFYAGGLSDFRADGIAWPLYGVTLCCFLLSDWLTEPTWSRLTILSAVLLCWFRPITAVYLAGVHLLLLLYLVALRSHPSHGPWARQLTGNILRHGLWFVAFTLPIPLIGGRLFYNYYVVGHVLSPEKQIRALEQGVVTLSDNLQYYPRTLFDFHLGAPVVLVWVLLALIALLAAGLGRFLAGGGRSLADASPKPVSWGVLILWLVIPLVILTMNLSKSPLVASIAVVPCVLLATFMLYRVLCAIPSSAPPRLSRLAVALMAAISVGSGMTIMANAEGRPDVHASNAAQVSGLMKAYDGIVAYCRYYGLKQPVFVTDRILEYFNGTAAAVIMFERSGLNIEPRELIAYNIFERAPDEVRRAAAIADCALLTLDPIERAKESLFPFQQTADKWEESYRNIVTSQMILMAELTMPGQRFQIYLRPRAKLEGESYGWLTADGAGIVAPARALRALPIIRLSGTTIGSKHLKGPLGTMVTFASPEGDRPGQPIPSRAVINADESYEVEIDTAGVKLPDSGQVRLRLTFDRYFVPKDLGINPDPRKLVIQVPKSTSLARGGGTQPAVPRQQLSIGDLYP